MMTDDLESEILNESGFRVLAHLIREGVESEEDLLAVMPSVRRTQAAIARLCDEYLITKTPGGDFVATDAGMRFAHAHDLLSLAIMSRAGELCPWPAERRLLEEVVRAKRHVGYQWHARTLSTFYALDLLDARGSLGEERGRDVAFALVVGMDFEALALGAIPYYHRLADTVFADDDNRLHAYAYDKETKRAAESVFHKAISRGMASHDIILGRQSSRVDDPIVALITRCRVLSTLVSGFVDPIMLISSGGRPAQATALMETMQRIDADFEETAWDILRTYVLSWGEEAKSLPSLSHLLYSRIMDSMRGERGNGPALGGAMSAFHAMQLSRYLKGGIQLERYEGLSLSDVARIYPTVEVLLAHAWMNEGPTASTLQRRSPSQTQIA